MCPFLMPLKTECAPSSVAISIMFGFTLPWPTSIDCSFSLPVGMSVGCFIGMSVGCSVGMSVGCFFSMIGMSVGYSIDCSLGMSL